MPVATYWRISNHLDLTGEGGRIASARWHTAGTRIVYMAESPAAALLEALVHLEGEAEEIPDLYTLLRIAASDELGLRTLDLPEGADWQRYLGITRELGDAWLARLETPLARVHSVIAPFTWNYLLNPEHPDAQRVQIESTSRERWDNRLLRLGVP
jgi:RES domain-containing protein